MGFCVTYDFKSSYEELRSKANIPLVYIQRLQKIIIEVYKIVNSIGPSYFRNMFTLKSSVYDLRNSQVLNIPNFNSQQYGKDTFRYQGAKLCNTLSNELKNTNSKDSFKKVIFNLVRTDMS